MTKFKKGDYLLRKKPSGNGWVVWRVYEINSIKYILTSINHYNTNAFPVGSQHQFPFNYVESYYKNCTYESVMAKII